MELKKTSCAFPFKFQSELIKYSFLKYLLPSKERRTLDAQIVFRLHRRFRNLIFASGDKGPLQFRTSTFLPRDISASRSATYWIGNCIRRMEKRNRNDGKKSLAWVEMALGGDLTMKYTHLLLLLSRFASAAPEIGIEKWRDFGITSIFLIWKSRHIIIYSHFWRHKI